MIRTGKNIIIVTLPTVVLVLLFFELILFRLILPATDPPTPYFDPATAILRYDPRAAAEGITTLGPWAAHPARWRINNQGWNSGRDYHPGIGRKRPLIAIIGDSFVEALQVDYPDSLAEKLERRLGGDYLVYRFGISGAPLSQYLHLGRYVIEKYRPQQVLVVVFRNDFHESLVQLAPQTGFLQLDTSRRPIREVRPRPRTYPPLKRALARSALARYLFYNCGFNKTLRKLLRAEPRAPVPTPDRGPDQTASLVADYVIGRLIAEHPRTRFTFVLDGPRRAIYSGRTGTPEHNRPSRALARACARHGAGFIDLAGPFIEFFQRTGRRLNFAEDYHWNQDGHEVIARTLADHLRIEPPEPSPD